MAIKKCPPKSIEQDIRPISLTPILAKELERIQIKNFRSTKEDIDDHQFGNKKHVSTTHMLVEMLHLWFQASDHHQDKVVRIIFLDYAKAFDRINHHKFIDKISKSNTPEFIIKWLTHFLTNRTQIVRIGDKYSKPLHMKGTVPQGGVWGMECFCEMIKDLQSQLSLYKYVDDSTIFEILTKNKLNESILQREINEIIEWTHTDRKSFNNKISRCKYTKQPQMGQPHRRNHKQTAQETILPHPSEKIWC